jgi:hypothetical protein
LEIIPLELSFDGRLVSDTHRLSKDYLAFKSTSTPNLHTIVVESLGGGSSKPKELRQLIVLHRAGELRAQLLRNAKALLSPLHRTDPSSSREHTKHTARVWIQAQLAV